MEMPILRNSLVIGLLALSLTIGLQLSCLLAQVGETLAEKRGELTAVLLSAQQALRNADATLAIVRDSAERNGRYYDLMARQAPRRLMELKAVTNRAALLLAHADQRTERLARALEGAVSGLTGAAEATMAAGADAAQALAAETRDVGYQSEQLLADTRATMRNLEALSRGPELRQTAGHLESATAHLDRAAANTEQATAAVRDWLSPRKKSFWRRLFELLLPRGQP